MISIMANPKSTNVKPLPNYNRLSLPEMVAVQFKAGGATYERIAAEMEAAYGFTRSTEAIRDWFRPGGRLTVALDQYSHIMATESLKESQLLLMRFTLPAVTTLCKFLNHPNDRIRLKAAIAIVDLTLAPAGTPAKNSTPMPREFMQHDDDLPDEFRDPADEELDQIIRDVRLTKQRIAMREMDKIPMPVEA